MKSPGKKIFYYIFLILFGVIMIYPLLWLFSSSFKPNNEIFATMGLVPSTFVWDSYYKGWNGIGKANFGIFFVNTFELVIPTVAFTLLSSTLVAYGFARFNFPLKKILFAIMISTLMLPNAIVIVPRYILFRNFGWIDTYLPFTIPALVALNPFFTYLMIQFFRGIPRELDESAVIDGCGSFARLVKILLPLCKPALFSVAIFQFIWTWNDFYNSLLFINSVKNYTVSLGLRMTLDVMSAISWNQIFAMSVVAIMPCVLVFFIAQKYFVEGIATTGLKG